MLVPVQAASNWEFVKNQNYSDPHGVIAQMRIGEVRGGLGVLDVLACVGACTRLLEETFARISMDALNPARVTRT